MHSVNTQVFTCQRRDNSEAGLGALKANIQTNTPVTESAEEVGSAEEVKVDKERV